MAALGTNNMTFLDLHKRLDPDGSVAPVVEMLYEDNEVLEDMTWVEGNLDSGNRTTIRTGIPEPSFRKFYGFTQPSKSTTAQITDDCGMLEDYSVVDASMAELGGRAPQVRMTEDLAFIEGFRNKTAENIFYGDRSTAPEAYNGFSQRFNSLSAENGENIIDAGGSGSDNTSIWLVCWSPLTCFGIVPKGSKAGLEINDEGKVTEQQTGVVNGGYRQVYRTQFKWAQGLVVKDWRGVVRIANIDKSALTFNAASGANLPKLLFEAYEQARGPKNSSLGRWAFYMSRDTRTKLRQQIAYGVQNSTMTTKEVGGKKVELFQDMAPLRIVDALAADEARIT